MKSYPKVPRYDHPTVDEEFFDANDLALVEKTDGSNFRFTLYEEHYHAEYSDSVLEHNPTDGDVVFGAKNTVQGCISDDPRSFDGNFKRAVTHLREHLDRDAVRSAHDTYDGPIVFFAENMVFHTLDYAYDENPPPALIGFDVYSHKHGFLDTLTPTKRDFWQQLPREHLVRAASTLGFTDEQVWPQPDPPANPFDQRFDGFLSLEEAWSLFEDIGLTPARRIQGPDSLDTDVDDYDVPPSEYGPVQAEGVVIRSASQNRRVKKVTEQFRELNRERWGMPEDEAESGAEWVTACFATNGRIRKHARKLVNEDGIDLRSDAAVSELTERVVEDIWLEEHREISTLSEQTLVPADIYPRVEDRVIEVREMMLTNADLADEPLDNLWANHDHDATTDVEQKLPGSSEMTAGGLRNMLSNSLFNDPERALVDVLVNTDLFDAVVDENYENGVADLEPASIETLHHDAFNRLWTEHWPAISGLDVEFTPGKLKSHVATEARDYVNARVEADISASEENSPDDGDDVESEAVGEFFE